MGDKLQIDEVEPRYTQPYVAGGDTRSCPVCDGDLTKTSDNLAVCLSPFCPFAESDTVRDVVHALQTSGKTIVEACAMALVYTLPEEDAPATEGFSVTDMESADWVLSKIAKADCNILEIQRMAEARIAEIRERTAKLLKPHEQTKAFMLGAYLAQLETLAKARLAGEKRRSVPLLHGVIGYRSVKGSLVIDDEAAVLAWADEWGASEVTRRSVVPSELRKHLDQLERAVTSSDGEATALQEEMLGDLHDCCHIEDAGDRFYVDAKLPGGGAK